MEKKRTIKAKRRELREFIESKWDGEFADTRIAYAMEYALYWVQGKVGGDLVKEAKENARILEQHLLYGRCSRG